MSKLDINHVEEMMRNALEELRDGWTNHPSIVELYGLVSLLALLLYTLFNDVSKVSGKVDSGPSKVSNTIPKYSSLCLRLCNFKNDLNHEHYGESFYNARLRLLRDWYLVKELFDYLQDYVAAKDVLAARCKKYHIKDIEADTKMLLNQYRTDDIVELVVLMRADGTLKD